MSDNIITSPQAMTQGVANDALIGDLSSYIVTKDDGTKWLSYSITGDSMSGALEPINSFTEGTLLREDLTVGHLAMRFAQAIKRRDDHMDALNQARQEAVNAMQVISGHLLIAADRHNLCEEYDEVIKTINSLLPSDLQLQARTRTYNVRVNCRRTIETWLDVEVQAASEEEAVEMVDDDPEHYTGDQWATDAEYHGEYEDEYEAEIV